MKQISNRFFYIFLLVATACHSSNSAGPGGTDTGKVTQLTPPKPDVTLTLPSGFSASVFADGLGKARHITVTANGYVYVKLASDKKGNSIVRLRDTNGDGMADQEVDFGKFKGTGIGIKNGYLYASSDVDV